MNKKEINEIRRRFKPEHGNIHQIYGCYVNPAKEIVSQIDIGIGLIESQEAEMYLNILKKVLSGGLGKKLIDIEFSTDQVGQTDEHNLLQTLRMTHLKDANFRDIFYDRIIQNLDMGEDSYVILMAADSYDVPYKSTDEDMQEDSSTEIFDYFICAVCPVKDSKVALSYQADEQNFRGATVGRVLTAPALGFMYPAFDDRSTNIYNALYYSNDTMEIHDDFIKGMFNIEHIPMSPGVQQTTFGVMMSDALGDNCDLEVVKAVHEEIRERLEVHKDSKELTLPELYAGEMDRVFENKGVPEEKIEAFNEICEKKFGADAAMNPSNLVDTKKFEMRTAGVKINVDADYFYRIETRIIDGKKYIMIPAEEGVEVNGIDISINE